MSLAESIVRKRNTFLLYAISLSLAYLSGFSERLSSRILGMFSENSDTPQKFPQWIFLAMAAFAIAIPFLASMIVLWRDLGRSAKRTDDVTNRLAVIGAVATTDKIVVRPLEHGYEIVVAAKGLTRLMLLTPSGNLYEVPAGAESVAQFVRSYPSHTDRVPFLIESNV